MSWDQGDDVGNRAPRSNERPATGSKLGDAFDGAVRGLEGMPGVQKVQPSTLRCVAPITGVSQTFIVQTYRHPERGDTILVEYVGAEGSFRLAMPASVADTIARQRDALTTKNRRRAGRQTAEARKAAGIDPAFLRRKK